MELDDVCKPVKAKDYYSKTTWWPENGDCHGLTCNRDGRNGNPFDKHTLDSCTNEVQTPESSEVLEDKQVLTSISVVDGEKNDDFDNYSRRILSTEIVEIIEDGKSITENQDKRADDIYVAVGKDDLDVVEWALDRAVSRGVNIFLIHVSPPITLIPTPVGKLARSQLTPEQVRIYIKEENNRRKLLLQKYIVLSNDAKVTAETILLESNNTAKAILELIPILNITKLVIGMKKPPHLRRYKNKVGNGESVKKNAPDFCEVTLVYNGTEVADEPYINGLMDQRLECEARSPAKRNFFHCTCFSGCVSEVKEI